MRWIRVLNLFLTPLAFVLGLAYLAALLVVLAVHRLSFVLCSIGAHRAGCWIRRMMTTPILQASSRLGQWGKRYLFG